jgi:hypothetical protein
MAVSFWFYAALGVAMSLWSADSNGAGSPIVSPLRSLAALGATLLLTVIPIALAFVSLLSYEDVRAVAHSAGFPLLSATPLSSFLGDPTGMGARTVLAGWLAAVLSLAAGAFSLTRTMCRGFDSAVGRPMRPLGSRVVSNRR